MHDVERRRFLALGGLAGGAACVPHSIAALPRRQPELLRAIAHNRRFTAFPFINVMDFIPRSLHSEILNGQPTMPVTSYIQDAIDDALNSAGHCQPVFFPAGIFLIDGTLKGDSGIGTAACSLVGAGSRSTTLRANTISQSQPMILYEGGSGAFSGAELSGFRVVGHNIAGESAGIGIKIAGKGGVRVSDCSFDSLHRGVRLSNESGGPFTEFCVCERCLFDDACTTALDYIVDGGHTSFHGSGLRDCRIKTRGKAIRIGPGATVYNAPLDVTVFANVPGVTHVVWSDSLISAEFHGHIGVEPQDEDNVTALACGPVILMGSVYAHDERVSRGTLRQAIRRQVFNVGGTPFDSPFFLPISSSMPLETGTSIMDSLPIGEGGALISVNIRGITPGTANYRYRATLIAQREPGGSGTVGVVSPGPSSSFQFGEPEFALNNAGELTITNPTWPGGEVMVFATSTQIGMNSNVLNGSFGHP